MIRSFRVLNYSVKNLNLLLIASVLLCAGIFSSCKSVVGPGGSTIVFPKTNVSFYRQVLPLFEQSCDYSGCHDDQSQAGNLALTSYASVKNGVGVVIPGDTLSSILVQRIKGINGTMPPPPASPLNSNQINGIEQWILEGAPPSN